MNIMIGVFLMGGKRCDFIDERFKMQRPEFDTIKDYEEFCKYYWYREELIQICKLHGLKAEGSKIELNNIIKAYFSGEKILP